MKENYFMDIYNYYTNLYNNNITIVICLTNVQ